MGGGVTYKKFFKKVFYSLLRSQKFNRKMEVYLANSCQFLYMYWGNLYNLLWLWIFKHKHGRSMLNNLGLLSTIPNSFIRHHQCIIIYERYALFYKKHIQEIKKMKYLNIFLIVFEQERTRRKKAKNPPSLLWCHWLSRCNISYHLGALKKETEIKWLYK